MTITKQQIDHFSLLGEHFLRTLETDFDESIVAAQNILSNATNLADTLVRVTNDKRITQARLAISIFFWQAAKHAERLEPSLVDEIREAHAYYEM